MGSRTPLSLLPWEVHPSPSYKAPGGWGGKLGNVSPSACWVHSTHWRIFLSLGRYSCKNGELTFPRWGPWKNEKGFMCGTRVRKSLPSPPPFTKFLPARVPIVIKIPLGQSQKRSRLGSEILGEGGTRDSRGAWKPAHQAGRPALRCGQSEPPAQACHYFLFHSKNLGGHLFLSQIPSCCPRRLCPGCKRGLVAIISARATMPPTAARVSTRRGARRGSQRSSHVPSLILSKAPRSSCHFSFLKKRANIFS